jgi:tetratricopeptide (TPR) repeat protein
MLRSALTACPGYEPAWKQLGVRAQQGKLDSAAKKQWGELIMKTAGRDRPDFAMEELIPLIQSSVTADEQSKLWDWAVGEFHARPDLVSRARLLQGKCWEKAGDGDKAWNAYKDIITRFPNDGKSIVYALMSATSLLHKSGKDASILALYEDAFRRIAKPTQLSPGFETASNYYEVGAAYAQLLEAAGRDADAKRVKRQIGMADEPVQKKG